MKNTTRRNSVRHKFVQALLNITSPGKKVDKVKNFHTAYSKKTETLYIQTTALLSSSIDKITVNFNFKPNEE